MHSLADLPPKCTQRLDTIKYFSRSKQPASCDSKESLLSHISSCRYQRKQPRSGGASRKVVRQVQTTGAALQQATLAEAHAEALEIHIRAMEAERGQPDDRAGGRDNDQTVDPTAPTSPTISDPDPFTQSAPATLHHHGKYQQALRSSAPMVTPAASQPERAKEKFFVCSQRHIDRLHGKTAEAARRLSTRDHFLGEERPHTLANRTLDADRHGITRS